MSELRSAVLELCRNSKEAAFSLRQASRAQKDAAIQAISQALLDQETRILRANADDVAAAVEAGTSAAIVDRLTLNHQRLADIAAAAAAVVALPDPVGDVIRGYTLPNGIELTQIRVPFGVVAMVYEARPNVTVDAAVLCLKSGNASLLRGSGSARHTNEALVQVMREAIASTGLPMTAITLVPPTSHETVEVLMQARSLVDVIIPRGGAGLISAVVENSKVPVIETGVGNCHLFVDESADLAQAVAVVVNSKTQRVSVCNALETLLVHEAIADKFLPLLFLELKDRAVTVHGDDEVLAAAEAVHLPAFKATDEDWAAEYYSLDLAARVVPDLDAAISHIRKWSTGHTDAILTQSITAADQFVAAVDSAVVTVNASTRFTDGGEFGFGAEIGISTQKLHARGPMGLTELTSTKYILRGQGQIRG